MSRVNHTLVLVDCACGEKAVVFKVQESDRLKTHQRRAWLKYAKKMGRRFFVEPTMTFTCRVCSAPIDLTKADEKQVWRDGERVQ